MNLASFIKERLSVEEYAFSWSEYALAKGNNSDISIRSDLNYAVKNGDLISLRHKFYLIMPPRYSRLGKLPVELYIDKLFRYLERRYYLGLYSAAKHHGAGHQQIQKDYVLHDKSSLLSIYKDVIQLDFFTVSNWPERNIITRKSDAGMFNISSPALTIVDLLYHQTKIGGFNRTLSVIEELVEEVQPADVKELLTWYPHRSVLQRFGFLLDEIYPESGFADLIYDRLIRHKFYPVLISPKSKQKAGAVDNRWKVDINIKMESDL